MTIYHLISRIFLESDFAIELIDSPTTENYLLSETTIEDSEKEIMLFGSCQSQGIDNHYLVVFLQMIPTDFVNKHIPVYFNTLRTHLGDRLTQSMTRNLSLIVCLNNETNSPLEGKILQIEEDPFDFKKYVLLYTKSEVDELQNTWKQSEIDLIPFLNQFLYKEGSFAEYKQHMVPSVYGLVARLFIKIPFMKLEVKERTFEDLQIIIRNQLGDSLTSLLDRLLNTSIEDILNELREKEGEQNEPFKN